ncbi:lipid droplet-associated protein [Amycolatopsis sp., V23-08]|uniref:Lipid droplet-associated protein n=1 Tax=Amycolatopsis heterodermiae TaxID=3110235 RepID=A0ABU5QX70_9PSEU|nr:lipid droplet-associated protein [Amycolatopsis sp., V23-08]MEA5358527.1 lipid droplet-associated protein [Amycolatopsis sp., V23-08]
MKPFPLPLRVAAGLAVSTAERVRELPRQLAGLPVTVVSQVLQASMRVQQHVTELAIKGDNALSTLRPVEDTPSWATFDEDLDVPPVRPSLTPVADVPEPRSEVNGHGPSLSGLEAELGDPWAEEERALAEDHADGEFDAPETETKPKPGTPKIDKRAKADIPKTSAAGYEGPAGLTGYDQLTLPQLRARLRQFSIPQLETILDYERAHADRSSFTGMLARRIANARKAQESGDGAEGS